MGKPTSLKCPWVFWTVGDAAVLSSLSPPDLVPSLFSATNLFFSTHCSSWEGAGLFSPWLSQNTDCCSPSLNLGQFFPRACNPQNKTKTKTNPKALVHLTRTACCSLFHSVGFSVVAFFGSIVSSRGMGLFYRLISALREHECVCLCLHVLLWVGRGGNAGTSANEPSGESEGAFIPYQVFLRKLSKLLLCRTNAAPGKGLTCSR